MILYPILGLLRLKSEQFSATLAGHIRQEMKIKKIAAQRFRKSLSTVNTGLQHKYQDPIIFFTTSKSKTTNITKFTEIPMYFAICQEKYHIFNVERDILLP